MESVLSVILFVILAILGLVHFYWMFGGEWGLDNALPTKENGERVLHPRKVDTGVVGMGLLLFGAFYLIKSAMVVVNIPDWILKFGSWVIPVIFILRAIGDFRYAGFFKKIKETNFGKWDTRLFCPLCLIIGLLGCFVALTS